MVSEWIAHSEWQDTASRNLAVQSFEVTSEFRTMAMRIFLKKNKLKAKDLVRLWRETRDEFLEGLKKKRLSDEELIDTFLELLDSLCITKPNFVVVVESPFKAVLLRKWIEGEVSINLALKILPNVISEIAKTCSKKWGDDWENEFRKFAELNWTNYLERVIWNVCFQPIISVANGNRIYDYLQNEMDTNELEFFRNVAFIIGRETRFSFVAFIGGNPDEYESFDDYRSWFGGMDVIGFYEPRAFITRMIEKNKLLNDKILLNYRRFLPLFDNLLGFYLNPGIAILIKAPVEIKHQNWRLHNSNAPAVVFEDGFEVCALEGIWLPRTLYWDIVNKTISPMQLIQLDNQEQKIVALKAYGWDNLLKKLPYKVLDEKVLLINGKSLPHRVLEIRYAGWVGRFLEYTCPSTGKKGLLRVPHDTAETETVEGARAWSFKPALRVNEKGRLIFVEEK